MHPNRFYPRLVNWLSRLGVGLLLLFLAACGGAPATPSAGSTPAPAAAATDDKAEITVWVDTTRLDGVKAYQQKHPDAKLKIVTVDRGEFPAKVLLFNNTNSGWPDVVFAEPSIVGQVSDAAHNFPLDLKDAVSEEVIKGFGNSLAPCWFDGKLFCLRNDVAQ